MLFKVVSVEGEVSPRRVVCYCHLEEKGVLKRRFKTPFRYRGEWKFPLDDFAPKPEPS